MSQAMTVVKRDATGKEIWHYTGTLLYRQGSKIVLQARFRPPDLPFMGTVFREGDRFVETYYTDRWYNIFEIHDREDDRLKGWYCNIGRPAVLEADDRLSYEDLALDLWVSPDGTQTVLDDDEFTALALDEETRSRARAAMDALQLQFRRNKEPGP